VIPGIEQMYKLDLRTITLDVPSQDVITRDNVSVKVSAVLYFRVIDPARAVVEVQNFLYATSQLAQTTLRSVCGQAQLDELLSERDRLNEKLQEIIDTSTEPWGIKVMTVEIKHIDLPVDLQRAMARQAEAVRGVQRHRPEKLRQAQLAGMIKPHRRRQERLQRHRTRGGVLEGQALALLVLRRVHRALSHRRLEPTE
jgi:regulator of protease activity HflC (stomatin/prohibitin superfamily)